MHPTSSPSAPTSPRTTRKPLQSVIGIATVAVALYSRLHQVVPFLFSWVFWGLVQRSARADRRWVSWPIAIPAALGLSTLIAMFLVAYQPNWIDILSLAVLPLWLYFRPSKLALWIELGVFSLLSIWVAWALPGTFTGTPAFSTKSQMLIAELYFSIGAAGASALALFHARPGPSPSPPLTARAPSALE